MPASRVVVQDLYNLGAPTTEYRSNTNRLENSDAIEREE